MKKNVLSGIAAMVLALVIALGVHFVTTANGLLDISLANVEALTSEDGGNTSYLKELEWVECPITKVSVAGIWISKNVFIPAGGTYTVYGTKRACTFWLFAACDQSQISPCQEI